MHWSNPPELIRASAYDEIDFYLLAEAAEPGDIASHAWPTTEWFDYSSLPDRIRVAQQDGEYCLMAANGNIFETSWYMRGFERIFMDLALRPEMAHAIFERVCAFYVEHFTKVLSAAAEQRTRAEGKEPPHKPVRPYFLGRARLAQPGGMAASTGTPC